MKCAERGVSELKAAIEKMIFGLSYDAEALGISLYGCYVPFVTFGQRRKNLAALEFKPMSHRNFTSVTKGRIS